MKNLYSYVFPYITFVFINVYCVNNPGINGDEFYQQRTNMIEKQLKDRGIKDKAVLDAFMQVPRQLFVPDELRTRAYDDAPLPIGYGQTISQPYVVAFMTEILRPNPDQKVLEIGTGSGYQAAILAKLYKEVYSIEIIEPLGEKAIKLFEKEGYNNIKVKIGDGYLGWTEYAPFDAIIVTCAPTDIPHPLVEQLAEGGKMIIPVGDQYSQYLYLLEKRNGQVHKKETLPVMFVPMSREGGDMY